MAIKQVPVKKAPSKKIDPERQAKLRKKYIVYGIGAGAVLGGGYLLFNYLQDRKLMDRGQSLTVNNIIPSLPTPSRTPVRTSSGFPLKKGSRGSLVVQLQNGLLRLGGQAASNIRSTSIRPDGTPDGVFGSGTERALRAGGFHTTVSQSLFAQITGGGSAPANANSKTIAEELIKGANSKNLFAVLNALKQMKDTSDYLAVRSHFNNARVGRVKVTTPVNALLSVAFKSNEPAKVKIRAEFRRMGLKQNSQGVWTLSGLGEFESQEEFQNYLQDSRAFDLVITEMPTLLKNSDGNYILPALEPNTVIGYLTNNRQGVSQILTENGVTVYAPTQNLKLI
ncbi:MAG: peptidoglycan-binding domain-containing protein [Bacteroidota bacterium]